MGAVLEAQAPATPVFAEPAAPYTPGEEPAFIAASRESGAATKEPQPSVEELFADLAEQTPLVEEPVIAPGPVSTAAPELEVPATPPHIEPGEAPKTAAALEAQMQEDAVGGQPLIVRARACYG